MSEEQSTTVKPEGVAIASEPTPLEPPSRSERRRMERAMRKQSNSLAMAVSHRELRGILQPWTQAAQEHELFLSFIFDRGLKIVDGRAKFEESEFREYYAEKVKANAEKARQAAAKDADAKAAENGASQHEAEKKPDAA